MKKFTLLTLLLCLTLLCACGGKTLSADCSLGAVREEILELLDCQEPVLPTLDAMALRCGIDPCAVEEYAVIMEPGAVFFQQILIFKVTDDEGVASMEEALKTYRENLLEQSRDYEPVFYALAEKSAVSREGRYIYLFIHPRQTELEQLFTAHLTTYEGDSAPVFTSLPRFAPQTPKPEPTPTPLPTAIPTPPPTEAPAPCYGLLGERERVSDSWFDDVLFVGNSVMQNLNNYVFSRRMGDEPNCMGKAEFLNVTRYSYHLAAGHHTPKPLQPLFRDQRVYTLEMALEETQCKKVYLNMGYSDLVMFPDDLQDTVECMKETVSLVRSVAGEETEIYLLAVTPRISALESFKPNCEDFRALNAELLAFAEDPENRCYYLDCYSMLADENGFLPDAYCIDRGTEGIHLNYDACRIWMDYIYTHTAPDCGDPETNE